MRAALLLASLLLTVSAVVPVASAASAARATSAAEAADAEASLLWGCDGVTLAGDFTGHCGNPCNGRVYVQGNRFADHICVQPLCDLLCSPPLAGTDASASSAGSVSLLGGCDGVMLRGQFTGHCGDTCNGRVFLFGVRQADHYC